MRAPSLMIALLLAACGGKSTTPAATTTPPPPAEPAAPAAPTAESILDGYVEATGGKAARDRVTALRMTGTVRLAKLGIGGKMTMIAQAPGQVLVVAEIEGAGRTEQGTDGKVAWEKNAMTGARVLAGDELARTLRKSTFHAEVKWRELYSKTELLGEAEYDGQPAFKLEMTTTLGDVETAYYHRETLLALGSERVEKTQMGAMPTKTVYREYTDYGGLKMPRVVVESAGGIDFEVALDNVELNPTLPATTFAVPADVIPLIKK